MNVEQLVASHYGRAGLEDKILQALAASGVDIDHLKASDLSVVDEFHSGGLPATIEIARDLELKQGITILDIGSGLGGPARHFADKHGCDVTGIDLTDEFVQVATALTQRCGLSDTVRFKQASALPLPFADASFNVATLLHVGMNISDKARLFGETHRVLKPGGLFAVYDVMRTGEGDLPYPMPWAVSAETSFVETPDFYREMLIAAKFEIVAEHDRRDLAMRVAKNARERAAASQTPPLGLGIILGPDSQPRFANLSAAMQQQLVAPTEIIARAM